MKEIYLITGNHGHGYGIKDHLEIFENIFKNLKYKIIYSKYPKQGKLNIIFDEFTQKSFNKELKKKTINTKYILVATEFITKLDDDLFSFNNFEYKKNKKKLIFKLINYFHYPFIKYNFYKFFNLIYLYALKYLKNLLKFVQNQLNNLFFIPFILFKNFFTLIGFKFKFLKYKKKLFLNFIIGFKFKFLKYKKKLFLNSIFDFILSKNYKIIFFKAIFTKPHSRIIYDHIRFLSFCDHLYLFDEVLTLHKDLTKQYLDFFKEKNINIKVYKPLLPFLNINKIKNNINKKIFSFYTSGTQTIYRKQLFKNFKEMIINKIKNNQNLKELKTDDIHFIHKRFNDKEKYNFLYSFHSPQTPEWSYASPVRLFRSINVDHSIPIIYKKFNDHPLEDLCLLADANIYQNIIKIFFNNDFQNYWVKKLINYNNLANDNNNQIIHEIKYPY